MAHKEIRPKKDVKIDISENARFVDKISVIGVVTDDGKYKKNRVLEPKVKKRITNYSSRVDEVHSFILYKLIKTEIQEYNSIQMCPDVSKNKLMNDLRKLFCGDIYWQQLESEKKIKISSVKGSLVDKYVKNVRNGIEAKGQTFSLNIMEEGLKLFDKKRKKRNKSRRKPIK